MIFELQEQTRVTGVRVEGLTSVGYEGNRSCNSFLPVDDDPRAASRLLRNATDFRLGLLKIEGRNAAFLILNDGVLCRYD